ncbi:hypothetical protein GCM10010358_71060 [Streptomyces minutiscleroticus]|uniref:Uncharacterized protein n=1 Tax=Streptomyces minutiscleroticus TaxID=68238 RepID=A0A918U855_9ACTN|nr:hypothetical protein GCM10010358_71060 [Streptomyces minutiscleroticus]
MRMRADWRGTGALRAFFVKNPYRRSSIAARGAKKSDAAAKVVSALMARTPFRKEARHLSPHDTDSRLTMRNRGSTT